MKVLLATREYPPFYVGGIGKQAFYLAKYLRRKGVEVTVVSFGDPRLGSADVVFLKPRSSIIARKHDNVFEDIKIPLDIVRYTEFCKEILRRGNYDVLHVVEPYVGGFIQYEHKVTTIHSVSLDELKVHIRYYKTGVGEILKRLVFYSIIGYSMDLVSIATSRIIVTPSIDTMWKLIRIYRVPREKVRFVPNGVEEPPSNEPDKLMARKILGISEDVFVIFTTAYHVARKRLETLVKATKVLKDKELRNIVIIIGGEGPLTEHLKRLALDLNVQDIVKFVGWIPEDKLPLYYKASDVFVITSEYEGGPQTMLEAGIRGVPLIVSDTQSGFMMIAKNNVHCLKFRLRDAADLAEKLIQLINDQSLQKKLSYGAKEFASMFRWDNIAEKMVAIYREVFRES
jgi:glycosyltransferase involved in cell wall biosynthesis